jgi:hypothetical protein
VKHVLVGVVVMVGEWEFRGRGVMANDWRACTFLACRVQSGVPSFLDEAVSTPFVLVAAMVRRLAVQDACGRGIVQEIN